MANPDSERLLRIESSLNRIEISMSALQALYSSFHDEVLGGEQPGRIQRMEFKAQRDSRRLGTVERGLCAIYAVVLFLQIAMPMARAVGWIK